MGAGVPDGLQTRLEASIVSGRFDSYTLPP